MTSKQLINKIESLPIVLQQQVENFVEFLIYKTTVLNKRSIGKRKSGSMKGMIKMSDDFDKTSDDF